MTTKLEDRESEEVILSKLLNDKDKVDSALLNINAKYFTSTLYRNLFKIISKVFIKHGTVTTEDLISNYLEAFGIDQKSRLYYLKKFNEFKENSVNDAQFDFALKSVKKAYVSNHVATILGKTTSILEDKGGFKAFDFLNKRLYDLKSHISDNNSLKIVDSRKTEDLIDRFKDMRDNPEKYKGIPSGWAALDNSTAGFLPGEYILIVAKSGGGKSMGLLNWANHAQKQGYNVVYITMEMNHWEVRQRQLSLESGITYIKIKTQNLTVEEINIQEFTLKNEIATRSGAFYIVDIPKSTVGFIEAQLRQLQQTMKIDMVVIDYFQLLKPEGGVRGSQGWEVAAGISNELRELARIMNVVVVTAHQLNAEGMKKTFDQDIELEDISVSKKISDPAHVVVGLIWDKTVPNEMRLSVPKCRGSRISSKTLWCDLDICKITDMPKSQDMAVEVSDLEV